MKQNRFLVNSCLQNIVFQLGDEMQPKKKLQDDKASSEKIRSSSGPEVKTSLDGDTQDGSLADKFLEIMDDFSEELGNLSFGERVCYIYCTIRYSMRKKLMKILFGSTVNPQRKCYSLA